MTAEPFEQHRELRDAREQSAASREILAALSRDVTNPGAVLDTVVESVTRLSGAQAAQLFLLAGDVFQVSRVSAHTPENYREYLREHPISRDRTSIVGRAAELAARKVDLPAFGSPTRPASAINFSRSHTQSSWPS